MARSLIPNSTQIPDVILDHWMAELSGAEFKVLLYIARRTYGFGKDSDAISLSQIANGITRRDGTTLDRGTGVSRMSVARALKVLEEQGIIIRRHNVSEKSREYEENTYSINLNWEPPSRGGQGREGGPHGSAGQEPEEGVVSKCYHPVSKPARGWYQNVTRVVTKVYTQETDQQETDQETASAKRVPEENALDAAAAALVQELVAHGVGRTAAMRYAQEKPDTCRRCLEYLPYAKFKTTKGAWLANAIRDEYGPPRGYEDAKARLARKQEAERRDLARNAHQKDGLAIREQKAVKVRSAYRQLEETQGEAFAAFTEYVQRERAKTARIAQHLSAERRAELLVEFDQPQRRLELFEAWMTSAPEFLARQATSPHAAGPPPTGLQH
jgi:phage replication O-like protein O